jgi:hypothetical protein
MPDKSWARIGLYSAGGRVERIAHAGLSADGGLCFVSGEDDYPFLVWDIVAAKVIWVAHDFRKRHPELGDFIENGHVQIDEKPAEGSYRIFGTDDNYALTRFGVLEIDLDLLQKDLLLRDTFSGQEKQRLPFKAFSSDWIFASFSDDGSVIAVMDPYDITFFGHLEHADDGA